MLIVFAALLYCACGIIVFKLKRRNRFCLRLILCTLAYLAFIIAYSVFNMKLKVGWFNFIFLILVVICMATILICFKTNLTHTLFYVSIAYTIEHVFNAVFRLITIELKLDSFWKIFAQAAAGFVIIAVIYLVFVHRLERRNVDGSFFLPKRATIIISVLAFAFIYVLSMYADSVGGRYRDVLEMYALGCGVLLLLVQFGIFTRSKIEEEKQIVVRAMAIEHKQHLLSKENIEQINIKCHDLKHQLALLLDKKNPEMYDEHLKELENLVKIYESEIRTGNSALDVVLTEKSLYCNKFNIKLHTFIDEEAIAILKEEDVYSLFGNILDNAIEYLVTVEDESLRIINLKITRKNKMIVIHSENYCPTALRFKNGLPVTTKPDTANHGYGTVSIKYIVKKYNGVLTIKQADEKFILNIMIPTK